MSRTGLSGVAAFLVLSMVACDAGDPIGTSATADDAALQGLLEAATDARTPSPGNSLFNRLAAEVPGFGGLYRAGRCTVGLVLTAEADVEQAVALVTEALTTLLGRSCADQLVVTPVPGEFTYIELQRFLQAARPLVRSTGVVAVNVSYAQNRIVIAVVSSSVARRALEFLSAAGVPEQAVTFRIVGGRG